MFSHRFGQWQEVIYMPVGRPEIRAQVTERHFDEHGRSRYKIVPFDEAGRQRARCVAGHSLRAPPPQPGVQS